MAIAGARLIYADSPDKSDAHVYFNASTTIHVHCLSTGQLLHSMATTNIYCIMAVPGQPDLIVTDRCAGRMHVWDINAGACLACTG
jgi:hypothetical protein